MACWHLAAVLNSADLEFTTSLHFRNVRDMVPAIRPALPAPQLVAAGGPRRCPAGGTPASGAVSSTYGSQRRDRLEVSRRLRGREAQSRVGRLGPARGWPHPPPRGRRPACGTRVRHTLEHESPADVAWGGREEPACWGRPFPPGRGTVRGRPRHSTHEGTRCARVARGAAEPSTAALPPGGLRLLVVRHDHRDRFGPRPAERGAPGGRGAVLTGRWADAPSDCGIAGEDGQASGASDAVCEEGALCRCREVRGTSLKIYCQKKGTNYGSHDMSDQYN